MPILDPNYLVGRTFLILQEYGQLLRVRIVKAVDDYDEKIQRDSTRLKLIYSTKYDTVEGTFTYNEILDRINNSEDDDPIEWKFKSIVCHDRTLPRSYPN